VGYYNSFVVKIWTDENEGKVRGNIQHVSSQESSHFLSLDKMLEFIIGHLNPPNGSLTRSDEKNGDCDAMPKVRNKR
jgi:hypothetical protein